MKRSAVIAVASALAILAIVAFCPRDASAKTPMVFRASASARPPAISWLARVVRAPARALGILSRRNNNEVFSPRALNLMRGLDNVRDRGRASLMRHGLETGRLRRDVEQKLIEAGKRNMSYELVERLSRY